MRQTIFGLLCFILLFGITSSFAEQKKGDGSKEEQPKGPRDLTVLSSVKNITSNANNFVKKIDSAFTTVTENKAYKTVVDGKALKLPYGIIPDNGNSDYALVVNAINLDPILGLTAEMYMKIPKGSGKHLYFLADKVPLSKNGQMLGDMNLFLLMTDSTKIGEGYDVEFKGLDNKNKKFTYVTFDCNGFKELFINGGVIFNKETLVLADSTAEKSDLSSASTADADANSSDTSSTARDSVAVKDVKLDFFVNADRLENLIVEFTSIPTVEFKKLPGFRVTIPRIVFDKSEKRNSPKFQMPSWYLDSLSKKFEDPNASQDDGYVGSFDRELYTSVLWQGLYIPDATIEIPQAFTEGKDGMPQDTVLITSSDFIIDEFGVTALTKAMSTADSGIVHGDIKGFK